MDQTIRELIAYLQSKGLRVYDSHVPETPEMPFVLIEARATPLRRRAALGGAELYRARIVSTVASSNADSIRKVARRVDLALKEWQPPPGDGWQVMRVTHDTSLGQPIQLDRDRGVFTLFSVDHYWLTGAPHP